jgi:hypothetical protein
VLLLFLTQRRPLLVYAQTLLRRVVANLCDRNNL